MGDPVRLVLNGEPRRVDGVGPTMTVLDWLRTVERLPGTKEGCAEGDCGACTIAVGRLEDRRVRYEAVNACLLALGQLDGRAVLTVEGLARNGTLHPVQEAIVSTDASQCGFCTPGIVMALFAFHHGGEPAEDGLIHDALAGNLCRCTGYRPIVDAAKAASASRRNAVDGAVAAALGAIAPAGAHRFEAAGQTFFVPRTLQEACAIRAAHPDARILAGGTDLGLDFSKERKAYAKTLWLSDVAELDRIRTTADHIEIGAAVSYTRALPLLDGEFPSIGTLIRRIGSRQIRNLGTIGGNIGNASPIGDMPPCLIALDATLVLRGPGGRREMAIEDFFLDYRSTDLAGDELIEAVRIPRLARSQTFRAYKVSKRFDQDISSIVGAYRLDLADGIVTAARIAYGGMAATPKRAPAAEAALVGRPWTQQTAAAAKAALAGDFAPITDFRAGADYRRTVAANLLDRLHMQTTGAAAPTEVHAL